MKLTESAPWKDDLCWCPSQCYYYFYVVKGTKKHYFCIYMRWRHEDPWRAYLSKADNNHVTKDYFEHELLSIKKFGHKNSLDLIKAQAIKEAAVIVKKILT